MAGRTATLRLRFAESSTAAGSPIAAINAHSGRGGVRPQRSFLAHRPLGGLFFRFAGRIACSSRQRLRFAQPLARRRMAGQRFCRLLTLSDLISAISEPVLRSVFGSAPSPLRGSPCQHRRPSGSCRQGPQFAFVSSSVAAQIMPLRGVCLARCCHCVIPAGVVGVGVVRQGSPPTPPPTLLPAPGSRRGSLRGAISPR